MQLIKIYRRYIHDVQIALEALVANKVKSFLTALGIMFGVGAVISMMAIGRGAQAEVLEQIKMIGANNILISPATKLNSESSEKSVGSITLSKGLNLADIEAIKDILPTVSASSPIINEPSNVLYNGQTQTAMIHGVSPAFFKALNMTMEIGHYFTTKHAADGSAVCVIGYNIYRRFFNNDNPIGKYIKCGRVWLKVIGVIEDRSATAGNPGTDIGASNDKIFTPAQTMLIRFRDKGKINPDVMEGMARGGVGFIHMGSSIIMRNGNDTETPSSSNKTEDQVDQIIVQIENSDQLSTSASVIERLLMRRHAQQKDFTITIPELLLKQQQETNDIFNIVLGAIAGISLIVGGIGIMNIMLASVWERIREIGTRQALGATQKDIVVQFLSESILISISGGIIGIVLGITLAYIIEISADIETIISSFSIIIAFCVSVSVGIIFGYLPAKRAAAQNPVDSLRH